MTDSKKAMIAKIKIAQKQLGLDDGAYRDILKRITGKDSSTKLTEPQLEAVINEMKRYGFKPTAPAKYGRKPRLGADDKRHAILNRIEAILADNKLPWHYLMPMVNNLGKEAIIFLTYDEMFKLMQMLETNQNRKRKKAKATTTGTT